jgi:beta-galactosidase beta subunit
MFTVYLNDNEKRYPQSLTELQTLVGATNAEILKAVQEGRTMINGHAVIISKMEFSAEDKEFYKNLEV